LFLPFASETEQDYISRECNAKPDRKELPTTTQQDAEKLNRATVAALYERPVFPCVPAKKMES